MAGHEAMEPGHGERALLDRALRRFGVAGELAALLMVGFGVLIIAFPDLTAWLVGLSLVLAGGSQLAGHVSARRLLARR